MDLEGWIPRGLRKGVKKQHEAYMRDSKRDTDVLNSLLDSVGEGKGGMIWEHGIETCILSYVK